MKKKSVKKKKEDFSLKQEYKKSWEYLRKSKNYLWTIVIIFLIMVIIGFLVPAPEFLSEKIMQLIEEIINKTQGMSSLELIAFIIGNNVQTSFLGMILGFVFGIFPIMTTIINGYLLGFVGFISVNSDGWVSLLKLLPHGIFELPAVIIALGLGLKLGTFPFKKNPRKSLRESLENSTRVFLLIVLPLLLIAGIIEGFLIFLIN
jgi:stage II sporulation protein M